MHISSILSTLSSLKEIAISIRKPEDALLIINSLPNLEILNGKKTKSDIDSFSQPQSFQTEIDNLNVSEYIISLFIMYK